MKHTPFTRIWKKPPPLNIRRIAINRIFAAVRPFPKIYWIYISALLIVGSIFGYAYIKYRHVRNNGLVTIARVIEWQTSSQGENLEMEIYFRNHTYPIKMSRDFPAGCLGSHFFVRIDTTHPTEYPIFYTEPEVPGSILDKARSAHFPGWKEFPKP
jgi:hypothetical protein